ncbi:MAG: CDP-glucose 4,6-dehydratase [Alphaproteobacteria bacterium]|nr:CDP-glucose 4,6-dehydratase [Alphaproteobacteria bacterium]
MSWHEAELATALRGRRVLVTGHTGFKGSWLCHWLHRLGAEVHGFALPPDTTPSLFDVAGVQAVLASHTVGDVRDADAVSACFAATSPEVVIHAAAQPLVLRSYADPKETFDTNVGGTVNVLEAVRAHGCVRALVNVTSDKCYDNREWVWGYRETDPMGGHDPYSASKGAAELVFAAYQRSFFAQRDGIGAVTVRAGNVIGGGDWAADRIVPDAIRALSDGQPIPVRRPHAQRPWQHVLEPVSGYLLLAARLLHDPARWSGPWNFGPDAENARPVHDLVDAILTAWGSGTRVDRSRPDAPHEAHFLRLSTDKARAELGWQPRWDFARTVAETVQWYRAVHDGADAASAVRAQIASYVAT